MTSNLQSIQRDRFLFPLQQNSKNMNVTRQSPRQEILSYVYEECQKLQSFSIFLLCDTLSNYREIQTLEKVREGLSYPMDYKQGTVGFIHRSVNGLLQVFFHVSLSSHLLLFTGRPISFFLYSSRILVYKSRSLGYFITPCFRFGPSFLSVFVRFPFWKTGKHHRAEKNFYSYTFNLYNLSLYTHKIN